MTFSKKRKFRPSASFTEAARIAFESLSKNKLRSFLTLLGIILATTTADDSSRQTIAATLTALAANPCWRRTSATNVTQSFARTCTTH